MSRKLINPLQIEETLKVLSQSISEAIERKGAGALVSSHEIAGIVSEEYLEMMEALRKNNHDILRSELLDIAVGAVFGVACIDAGALDW